MPVSLLRTIYILGAKLASYSAFKDKYSNTKIYQRKKMRDLNTQIQRQVEDKYTEEEYVVGGREAGR